jgi:hypothetical protein
MSGHSTDPAFAVVSNENVAYTGTAAGTIRCICFWNTSY